MTDTDVTTFRRVFIVLGIGMLVGAAALMWSRAYLFSEASELFVIVVERGMRYRIDQALVGTRLSMWIPILPLMILANVTDHLGVLVSSFGAPHVAVPVIALVGVMVGFRRQFSLLLFVPVASICLIGLPGQIFVVSGQLSASQLTWVLLVCVFLSQYSRWAVAGALGLTVVLFFLHPVVTVYFAAMGATLLLIGWRSNWRPSIWPIWGVTFALVAAARAWLILSTADVVRIEDRGHPSLMKLEASFTHPRVEFIAIYFALIAAAVAMVLWRGSRSASAIVALLLAGLGALLAFFLGNPLALQHGVHYISWVVALVVPLQAIFLWEITREGQARSRWQPSRASVAVLAVPALIFGAVLTLQSVQFRSQLATVRHRVEAATAPCVAREGLLSGLQTSFDDEFGTFEYEYLATGDSRDVTKVVLDEARCGRVCQPSSTVVRGLFRLRTLGESCVIGHLLE